MPPEKLKALIKQGEGYHLESTIVSESIPSQNHTPLKHILYEQLYYFF